MTLDDDRQLRKSSKKSHYIDFVEFCLADVDTKSGTEESKSTYNSDFLLKNSLKFSSERLIDFDLLNNYKEKCQTTYNIFQECLLLFKIDAINKYTTYIPLGKLFENALINNEYDRLSSSFYVSTSNSASNSNQFSKDRYNLDLINARKKILIDTSTNQILTRNKELNWVPIFNSLYPIKTIGDGNCLCHSVLSYMIGMQDINLVLRETLKNFMNNPESTDELKKRWISTKKSSALAGIMQMEEETLNKEWSEVINMRQSAKINESNQSTNNSNSSTTTSSSSLVYLEDIHIFALANLLRRTIIIISLPTLKNIEDIHLRGIYLPLLNDPTACCKDPIVIAFHNFHFMPLLFAFDEHQLETLSDISSNVKYNDKYFHFDNLVNTPESMSIDETYEKAMDFSTSSSNNVMMKRKLNKFFNFLPLVYFNSNEKMKIHFLNESENINHNNNNSIHEKLLKMYLNITEIELDQQDIDPDCLILKKNQKKIITCCYLNKQRINRVKNDGISSFLSFIVDSDKKFTSENQIQKNYQTDNYFNTNPLSENLKLNVLCQTSTCTKDAMPNKEKYKGLCFSCYENLIRFNDRFEVNHEKEPQNLELNINSNSKNNYIELGKMVIPDENTAQRSPPVNKFNQLNPPLFSTKPSTSLTSSSSSGLKLCDNMYCKNVIQNRDQNYCDSCSKEKSLKFKPTPRVIEIPVHVEKSKNSNLSAYDTPMTSRSRLYNIPTMNKNGILKQKNSIFDENSKFSSNYNSSGLHQQIPVDHSDFQSRSRMITDHSNFINEYNRFDNCISCHRQFYVKNQRTNTGLCEACENRSSMLRNVHR